MKMNKSVFERYKEATKKQRILMISSAIVGTIIVFFICAWLVGRIFYVFSSKSHGYIYYGLSNGLLITLILFGSLFLFFSYGLICQERKNRTVYRDENGVSFMRDSTKGSARFAERDEVEESFYVGKLKDTDEMVYGQYSDKGEEVVAFKPKAKGGVGTRHTLMVASSGSGKSFSFVLPNILQCVKRGHSAVVVDPSGELYRSVGQFCRNSGYDVKLLNLSNLDYSECWNCLAETIDKETGRLSADRLRSFVQIFLKNSQEGKDDQFWLSVAQNLIECTIGFLAVKREQFILNNYKNIYANLTGESSKTNDFSYKLDTCFVSFPWCEKEILKIVREKNKNENEFKNLFDEIKANAPEFTIEKLYFTLNSIDYYLNQFEEAIPIYHPAYFAYKRFLTNSSKVVEDGAKQGSQLKFKIFDDYKLRKVLSSDGINFNTINKKKSIYFVAIPDTDVSLRPIASLFFSFFYKDVQEVYDYEADLSLSENRDNQCIPVMAMLDEFASLGVLTGDENLFATIMSDCRKRLIYNCIIIQYFSQLEGLYGEHCKDAILSNCSVTLSMGANDPSTCEFLSRKTGIATVLNESHSEVENLLLGSLDDNRQIRVSSTQRNLMTNDEINRMTDKVLVMKHGCNAFKINPLPWIEHPAYTLGLCPAVSYRDNIEPFEKQIYKNSKRHWEKIDGKDADMYINDLVDKLTLTRDQKKLKELQSVMNEEQEIQEQAEQKEKEKKQIKKEEDELKNKEKELKKQLEEIKKQKEEIKAKKKDTKPKQERTKKANKKGKLSTKVEMKTLDSQLVGEDE